MKKTKRKEKNKTVIILEDFCKLKESCFDVAENRIRRLEVVKTKRHPFFMQKRQIDYSFPSKTKNQAKQKNEKQKVPHYIGSL